MVKTDAYHRFNTPCIFCSQLSGLFKFHFWRFNGFVEVVVDDRLPVMGGQLIYARNREEPDEFWVALLEKAYAK